MRQEKPGILVVEDQDDIRSMIEGILDDEGYATRQAATSDEAFGEISAKSPDLIILDIWLEGSDIDGMEILKRVIRDDPDMPVIMISGHGTIEMAVNALQLGAYDFIEKPFKSDRLLLMVRRALEQAQLKRENRELKLLSAGVASDLLGVSPVIAQLRQSIERVAPTGSRILITGNPGTGKEVAARMIHRLSKRADGPYVSLNCAILRPEKIETELFGDDGSQGVLEEASGGTLFLDEVSDMPLEVQSKIVRLLQDQSFSRNNGRKVEIDVRLLASSSRDLKALISDGKFREDLYYRLNVVPINMPSLADRPEDIEALAGYFMEQAAKASGLQARKLGEDALAVLRGYSWPGNVRQLRNVIEWLLIMAPGDGNDEIMANMLPPEIIQSVPNVLEGETGALLMSRPLKEAREIFEREYLLSQVSRFGGNISKTANFVGMERSALHRKLKLLGIQGNDKDEKERKGGVG